uniref:Uncharacterized protein n=1 Tax=Rhizophora mucronata TaxID=61149 RepID=A0A2P2P8U9_RHIMU
MFKCSARTVDGFSP